jgi:hypothetical protein
LRYRLDAANDHAVVVRIGMRDGIFDKELLYHKCFANFRGIVILKIFRMYGVACCPHCATKCVIVCAI